MNKKIIALAVFVAIVVVIKILGLDSIFTFENLQGQREFLGNYVDENYTIAVGAFILLYIVSVAFMVPIATLLTLAGGFLFGSVLGAVFVNLGATIGAFFAFLFARYIIGDKIQERYSEQLNKFNKELEENKFQYLLTLRFLPIFPFFLINFLSGVTKLDIKTFIITTSIGIIPGSFVYTYAGSQLATISSMGDIFTKEMLIAFILLGTLSLMPVIVKKIKAIRGVRG